MVVPAFATPGTNRFGMRHVPVVIPDRPSVGGLRRSGRRRNSAASTVVQGPARAKPHVQEGRRRLNGSGR